MIKLCTNCKHKSNKHYGSYCANPKLGINHVDGFPDYQYCYTTRKSYKECGPDAQWFEPKPSLKDKICQLLKLK